MKTALGKVITYGLVVYLGLGITRLGVMRTPQTDSSQPAASSTRPTPRLTWNA